MKDEHDKYTADLAEEPPHVPQGRGAVANQCKPKRLPRQSAYRPPEGAKPLIPGSPLGFGQSVVPVSSVARDMGISARRVRVMLAEGRLAGQQSDNGYWEVFYPYRYILGTRGPALTRQRNLPEPAPKKRERNSDWW